VAWRAYARRNSASRSATNPTAASA